MTRLVLVALLSGCVPTTVIVPYVVGGAVLGGTATLVVGVQQHFPAGKLAYMVPLGTVLGAVAGSVSAAVTLAVGAAVTFAAP